MRDSVTIKNLTFTYENTHIPLFDSVSFQLQKGWTGIVGTNGSGKTTLLKLLTQHLFSDNGSLNLPKKSYYCEQQTDFAPMVLKDFLCIKEHGAFKIRKALGIQKDWDKRWNMLSY